jgi:PTH1 family peptidyl-tRNA hydrolase
VSEELGTTEFPRLRLGVGPRPPEVTLTEFVLEEFPEGEEDAVAALVERGADAALAFARDGLEAAMREFNKE